MKKQKNILIALFSVIAISSVCYLFSNQEETKKRKPANVISGVESVTNLFGLSIEGLFENIYSVGKNIGSVPYEAIKQVIIDHKLVAFIKERKLDTEVEARILKRLDDEKYVARLVSFLLNIKQNYVDKDKEELVSFKGFVKKQDSSFLSKGSTHSLFTIEDHVPNQKKEQSSTKALPYDDLIIAGIKLYDVLFIQNESIIKSQEDNGFSYKRLTEKDQDIVDQAKPIIRKLLQSIVEGAEEGDIKNTLSMILSTDYKLEAATVSLIDFARGLVNKYYYAFISQFQRKEELARWMLLSYDEKPKDLMAYLELSLQRKYAVHIVVDGLQGHLLKNLSKNHEGSKFIKQVYADHLNAKDFKPKNTPTISPKHITSLEFLKEIQNSPFENKEYLSFFKTLYEEYPNSIAQQGVSSTPTISVRNLPLIETGAGVAGEGSTGVPNFHFYDRKKQRAFYFFGNDALLLSDLTKESGMKNMFSRLPRKGTFNCNAIYDDLAKQTYDGLINLAVGEKVRDFGEKLCFKNLKARAKVEKQLRVLKEKLLKNLGNGGIMNSLVGWLPVIGSGKRNRQLIASIAELEDQGMPQYLLYYNPWPDHFAHFKGPFSDEIISSTGELPRLDYWLSQLNSIYEESGVLNRTLFAMAGDHGLAPIFFALNPERLFDKLNKKNSRAIIVKKISSDEGEGAKINHSYKTKNIHPVDVIVASTAGGNYMMDFFAGLSKKERERQVYYSDLINWKPLDNRGEINIISFLAKELRETLDYLVVREARSNLKESHTRVIAYRNNQMHNELIIRKGNRIYYEMSDGDLLDIYSDLLYREELTQEEATLKESKIKECLLQAKKEDIHSWCSEKDWRALTSLTARPDSVVQLSHLYDLKRAGSVNLFPKAGIGYNTKVPGRHAGESFHEKDAFVGFWGVPVKDSKVVGTVDNGILAPTIYEYLTGKKALKGKDGWGYPSILETLTP